MARGVGDGVRGRRGADVLRRAAVRRLAALTPAPARIWPGAGSGLRLPGARGSRCLPAPAPGGGLLEGVPTCALPKAAPVQRFDGALGVSHGLDDRPRAGDDVAGGEHARARRAPVLVGLQGGHRG